MKVENAVREFKYGGMVLQDPDPSQSPEEVKAFYANIYPELNNAEIETDRKGSKTVHVFRKAVGTKGIKVHEAYGDTPLARAAGAHANPLDPEWPRYQRVEPEMSDDEACRVGTIRLQSAMLAKLNRKRKEGRGGWHKPDECDPIEIAQMLFDHMQKGDPVDIANFAMMLHNREDGGAAIRYLWKKCKEDIERDMLSTTLRDLHSEINRLLRVKAKRGKA